MVQPKVINFNVRGSYFSMRAVDLMVHSDSYFAHLLKDEWNSDTTRVVDLDRDEEIFRYIHHYVYTCDLYALSLKIVSLDTWLQIREDADFFNLGKLVEFCDTRMSHYIVGFVKSNQLLNNVRENFLCVEVTPTQPTDEVLACMVPFYSPSIATCRLLSYPRDMLVSADAATAHTTDMRLMDMILTNKQNYQRCVKKDGMLAYNTLTTLQSAFHKWPLDFNRHTQLHRPSVYVYSVGGRRVNSKPDHDFKIVGVVLYIFNRAFTGGAVSTTVNGQTVSINRPGECMDLAAGANYSVDTVTSGALILVEFAVHSVSCDCHPGDGAPPPPPWIIHRPYEPLVYPDIIGFNKLQLSLNVALGNYDGVIICLPRFYPIKYCANSVCSFVTDPDLLTGKDEQLYDLLCADYDVSVVSVYIGRVNNYSQVHNVHVLDYIDTNSTNTVDNQQMTPGMYSKLKVVSPMFGFGETFCCDIAPLGELVWGSVLTGLMVTQKEI